MATIYFILIVAAVIVIWFWLMNEFVNKPIKKFYDNAVHLEFKIRNEDNEGEQQEELYKLNKLSGNKHTGAEIKRLASMMEVKYNISILKK